MTKEIKEVTEVEIIEPTQNNDLFVINESQSDMIAFDEDRNIFTANKQFMESLAETPKLVDLGKTLLDTDINELDEAAMTQLSKDIKPLTDYNKKFTEFRAAIKRRRNKQTEEILNQYDEILKQGQFEEIPVLVKDLNRLKKDFKENRANKRWEELNVCFQAQLEIYPELTKLSPKKLGSFSYYRVMHPDMVSEAKTKPVTEKTIKQLNKDVFDYATDIKLLQESAIDPRYHVEIVDQYASEPSTSTMLNLINEFLAQQLKDEKEALEHKAKNQASKLIKEYWDDNQKIESQIQEICDDPQFSNTFNAKRLALMNAESKAILNALNFNEIIVENEINEDTLDAEIKTTIGHSFARVKDTLTDFIQKQKDQLKSTVKEEKPKEKQPEKETPKVETPKDPNQWILDYLQEKEWHQIHNNNVIKMQALIELTQDFAQKVPKEESVWKQNIKNPDEFMEVVKFLTDL